MEHRRNDTTATNNASVLARTIADMGYVVNIL